MQKFAIYGCGYSGFHIRVEESIQIKDTVVLITCILLVTLIDLWNERTLNYETQVTERYKIRVRTIEIVTK